MMTDIWEDEENATEINSLDTKSVISKMKKEGYRTNRSIQEEWMIQKGFDQGFQNGIQYGKICGHIYALICKDLSSIRNDSELYSERKRNFDKMEDILLHKFSQSSTPQLLINEMRTLSTVFSSPIIQGLIQSLQSMLESLDEIILEKEEKG